MKLAFTCTKLRHDLALASREPFHVIRPFNIAETWMANASRQQGVFPRGLLSFVAALCCYSLYPRLWFLNIGHYLYLLFQIVFLECQHSITELHLNFTAITEKKETVARNQHPDQLHAKGHHFRSTDQSGYVGSLQIYINFQVI